VWAFDVMKDISDAPAGDEVRISVNNIVNLPSGASITLVDRTLDRQIALDEGVAHTFYLGTRDYVATEEEARFRIIVGTESFVEDEATRLIELPKMAALYQNYPNPFNPYTVIHYDVVEAGVVSLHVYNMTGALVKVFKSQHRERGRYEVRWDGEDSHGARVSSGVYLYKLVMMGFSQTRKMVLVR